MSDGRDPKDRKSEGHTALGVGEYTRNERTASLKPGKAQLDAPEIPGYRITAELGEGGMGTVYEALQENPHRKVAIKVLHRTSQSAFVRFQNEAEVMARLDHPGIARVLEAGEADGHPFLVMDFIDGATLEDVAPKRALRTRLELFVQVCDAVHHAHVKGVIHRDLKPTNVMVREGERAVVLDFGVARLADDKTSGPTRAGELVGTPLYMSPEQARLRPDEVDARTDVYTLGVILYELASGELPYEAPRGLPLPVLTVLICDEPPVPLGKRVPALRGDLEAIAAKALSKEPAVRYQSVAALADDLRKFLAGLPVSVRMPGPLERTRRFIRRRPLAAFAIASALSGVIIFASVVTALWLDARAARRTAEQAQARTEVARQELEQRTVQLTLQQARSALARDPTEALAWLATLPARALGTVDGRVAWMIADEARARGVARDVLREHRDEVHWVEPLARGFVTGGYDGRVIAWTPGPRVVFTADKGRIHVARPSPDGTRLAIGGDDGLLVVMNVDGTDPVRLGHLHGDVQRIEWSADGTRLAASSDRGNLWIFDGGAGPGRELMPDDAPDAGRSVGAIAFAPNGTLLVGGNDAGTVRAWSLADGKVTETALGHEIIALWTDGARILAVDADGGIYERSLSGSVKRDVDTKRKLKRAAFAPGAAWLVVGGVGGEVLLVNGDTVSPLHVHHAQVRSLAISGDERWIISGGDDGSLIVADQRTRRVLALRGHTGRIRALAIAGSTLYSTDSDGTVRRWELSELGTNVLATTGPAVQTLVATPEAVAAVDEAGTLTRWSLADGARTLADHVEGRVTDLAIDGANVIEGRADGQIAWHGTVTRPLQLAASVRALAVSRDVLVGTSAGPIQRCNRTGLTIGTVAGHPGGTDVIAMEPGGQRFASGGQDRLIRVWGPSDGAAGGYAPLAELPGPQGDTHFLAYSSDGKRLVAAGNDGTVFAWDVKGGVPDAASRKILAQHTGAVTALAVSGDVVASAGRDNTLTRTFAGGTVERATIATAATTLALGPAGTVFAVTRGGAALRWERGQAPVVEIEYGVIGAAPIDAARWVLAFADGALVVIGLGPVKLTDLDRQIAALTSFRLPAAARPP